MTHAKAPFTCDDFTDTLADFLERDVTESTRAAMESHALACGDCGPLLADLRKLRIDAANLPELSPSRDLWAGVAQRIETPVVAIGRADEGTSRRAKNYSRVWMGLAAAALVGITATITYHVTKQTTVAPVQTPTVAVLSSPRPDTQANTPTGQQANIPTTRQPDIPTTPKVVPVSNKPSPEQTYDVEIGRLRKIVDGRRGELDSSTVAVLEKNLRIIDNAIAQCKLALRTDPASRYLNESLVNTLDSKVQLLRAAALLPAKM